MFTPRISRARALCNEVINDVVTDEITFLEDAAVEQVRIARQALKRAEWLLNQNEFRAGSRADGAGTDPELTRSVSYEGTNPPHES